MKYEDLTFKVPKQCDDYDECSTFVTESIETIIQTAIDAGRNKIVINAHADAKQHPISPGARMKR